MKISWGVGISISIIAFMLVSFGLIYFSFNQDINLVGDDYYKAEIEYSKKMESKERAGKLREKLQVKVKPEIIEVTFPKYFEISQIEGFIYFYRPSDSKFDIKLPIEPDSSRKQIISTKNMINGLWKIKVDWNIDSTTYYYDRKIMVQ